MKEILESMVKSALQGHLSDIVDEHGTCTDINEAAHYFHGERDTLQKLERRLGYDGKITSALKHGDYLRTELHAILEEEGEEAALERRQELDRLIAEADLIHAPDELKF